MKLHAHHVDKWPAARNETRLPNKNTAYKMKKVKALRGSQPCCVNLCGGIGAREGGKDALNSILVRNRHCGVKVVPHINTYLVHIIDERRRDLDFSHWDGELGDTCVRTTLLIFLQYHLRKGV